LIALGYCELEIEEEAEAEEVVRGGKEMLPYLLMREGVEEDEDEEE
jgi:hypothetical protein